MGARKESKDNVAEFVVKMREQIVAMTEVAHENIVNVQRKQKTYYIHEVKRTVLPGGKQGRVGS